MNVLIPAAGAGSRFTKENYKLPKPLIDVNGFPMITSAISSLDFNGNYYFLFRNSKYSSQLINAVSSLNRKTIILIDYLTQGAADSALLFEPFINNDNELIIANCDQIMNWDSEKALDFFRQYDSAVVTIKSTDPKHSYVKLENNVAVKFAEKTVISDNALTGIHYWKKGKFFVESAKEMIRQNDRSSNGEFYIAPTFNYILKMNLSVGVYQVSDNEFFPVGTPTDLKRYLNESF
jgi:UDP-N-acetylglucosamine diphosphorylase / glucose-1-phosphate thymidylyltransferase / UDP-N-acetylgalactosamine diphosphorylase / glucosamine-1-phosphate N-acetyltransferase / galactosamine-1-phosphate N-acetyltransferase